MAMEATAPECAIEWGVKESLIEYMRRAGDLRVSVEGEAAFDDASGVRLSASIDEWGRVCARGSVTLTAHQGALVVPIVGAIIDRDLLTVADPVGDAGERLVLMELAEPVEVAEGVWERQARLAPQADELFRYNYLPRVEFAPVRMRVTS